MNQAVHFHFVPTQLPLGRMYAVRSWCSLRKTIERNQYYQINLVSVSCDFLVSNKFQLVAVFNDCALIGKSQQTEVCWTLTLGNSLLIYCYENSKIFAATVVVAFIFCAMNSINAQPPGGHAATGIYSQSATFAARREV